MVLDITDINLLQESWLKAIKVLTYFGCAQFQTRLWHR